ncbi:hypothetical protein BDQ17DRAFT_1235044, partial [Cyathus striatus]
MDSPFKPHLGTNYIPSIDETKQIRDFLIASDKEVRDIENEIDQLRRRLDLLHEKRSKILYITEQHRALISHTRKLSRDVLEEIFLACLPVDRNPCMSTAEAPMLLTCICSSWRDIAHSTPRLWAAIHIALPHIDRGNRAPMSSLLLQQDVLRLKLSQRSAATREWLDRTGTCPLTISI